MVILISNERRKISGWEHTPTSADQRRFLSHKRKIGYHAEIQVGGWKISMGKQYMQYVSEITELLKLIKVEGFYSALIFQIFYVINKVMTLLDMNL